MANPFQTWIAGRIRSIGWSEFLRLADGAFTQGAMQGWCRGSLPEPSHQIMIAKITGVGLPFVKDLVWKAQESREITGALTAPRKRSREGQRATGRARRALSGLILALSIAGGSGGNSYELLNSRSNSSLLSDVRRRWPVILAPCPA